MKIVLKQINIANVTHSSGIFSGDNLQVDWKCYKKINEGFGTMQGSYNKSSNNRHIVQKAEFENKKENEEEQSP